MSVFIGYPSFMAYQMMKGKKDNNDGFPSIPGTIARYSALGLTNEEMSKNPVWVDKTGNGHDLQMKNFAWGGMSGVGGYKFNFKNSSEWSISVVQLKEHKDNRIVINNRLNAIQLSYKGTSIKIVIKLTGVEENNSRLKIYDDIGSSKEQSYNKDGIYEIDYIANDGANYVYFYITGGNYGELDLPITIEQLPLYPGALVFDGVDDYGTCDNFPILNKEKGYTALRQWINNSTNGAYLVSNAINNGALGAFIFERDKDSITYSFGRATKISVNYNNPITYQISNSYNSVEITMGTLLKGNDTLLVGVNYKTDAYLYANVAIWELVFLDHDATEEELTKIKDYFIKTYPWLFPDQAWTVVGKTNEDEDRATIANITGNGNDLILSNFGFIEGSGYNEEGEYAGYLVTDGVDDKIISSNFKFGENYTVVGEWKFLQEASNVSAGFVKNPHYWILYNYKDGINAYIKADAQGSLISGVRSIKASTSKGDIYPDFNSYVKIEPGKRIESQYALNIAVNSSIFTKLAFKNLAIYPTVLSKDDCIKAYNYLQTLKAK